MSDSVREAFENWHADKHFELDSAKDNLGDGSYRLHAVQDRWEIWQAALSANGGEVEPVAWVVFADNGNIRIWGREKPEAFPDAAPLYLSPTVKKSLTVQSEPIGYVDPDSLNDYRAGDRLHIPVYRPDASAEWQSGIPVYLHPAPPSVAVPEFLLEMSKQMREQPNRMTAHPFWQVRCNRYLPTLEGCAEHHIEICGDDGVVYRSDRPVSELHEYLIENHEEWCQHWSEENHDDDDWKEAIECYFDLDCDDLPDGLTKVPVQEIEEVVSTHLTQAGAEQFIKRKQHDYPKLFTYVESAYWSPQLRELQDWIISLTAAPQPDHIGDANKMGGDVSSHEVRPPKHHTLKTDPAVFDRSAMGRKPWEIRLDDRNFQVGDTVTLKETVFSGAQMREGAALEFTGKELTGQITYVLRGPKYGLADGWCIFSLSLPTPAADAGKVVQDSPIGWIWDAYGQRNFTAGTHHKNVLEADGLTLIPVYTHPAQPRNEVQAEALERIKARCDAYVDADAPMNPDSSVQVISDICDAALLKEKE